MTAIMKNHETSLKNVNGYIASMFANIFVKNPRTLSVGDKVNYSNLYLFMLMSCYSYLLFSSLTLS